MKLHFNCSSAQYVKCCSNQACTKGGLISFTSLTLEIHGKGLLQYEVVKPVQLFTDRLILNESFTKAHDSIGVFTSTASWFLFLVKYVYMNGICPSVFSYQWWHWCPLDAQDRGWSPDWSAPPNDILMKNPEPRYSGNR